MASLAKLKIRHIRIRKRVRGTAARPRLAIHFSGKHIYAQIIDDEAGRTLAAAATTEKTLREGEAKARPNAETSVVVGKLIAERGKNANIEAVVFDRGGFQYHGKVKALADAAREAGLKF